MTTPSHEEILFQAAAQLPGPERAAFLDRECAVDLALRARLNALLAAHEQSDGVLAGRADTRPTITVELPDLPDPAVGMTIGRYKLLEKLGEGGCGVVYVAEQTEPVRRRVALKVIKLGMDTKQVVARFEAERQALAMMDHPNIAKVLDAGTTEAGISQNPKQQSEIPTGRPYFVMELVRGIRITDYCDRHNLSTKERLDLFIKVCQAIQHAHQKGIIHRDVKPSNILVTLHDGIPVPKVIDFGIAKATQGKLTDATVYTQLHQFVGTPAYMSPEQAEMSGLDIDTRSDIYSLGVLLYELLTGTTPFDGKELIAFGIDAMRKTIREKEPLRPSTRLRQTKAAAVAFDASRSAARHPTPATAALSQIVSPKSQIDPDLDWIVMKCLEKDRARRYETANGLAMDLSRHLKNEPVIARPPSAVYRFQKALRRNKLAFTAAMVVVAALVTGIGVATWRTVQTGYAHRETEAALQRETAALNEVSRAKEALEEALRIAQRTTYIRGIALAHQEWLADNFARANLILEECGPADIRGFEWHYLRRLFQARGALTVEGYLEGPSMVSPGTGTNGIALATIYRNNAVSVLAAATAEEVFSFPAGTNDADWLVMALSAKGDRFATADRREATQNFEGTITVWDRPSRQVLRLIPVPRFHSVNSISFSPDGGALAAGLSVLQGVSVVGGCVMWWDVTSGRLAQSVFVPSNGVWRISFTPDASRILGLHQGGLSLWDATNGSHLRTMGTVVPWFEAGFALAPDGRHVALFANHEDGIHVLELETGKETAFFRHSDHITGMAYSGDGRWFAGGSRSGTVRIWDAKTHREVRMFRHPWSVDVVGFSPDSRKLLVGNGRGGLARASTYLEWDSTRHGLGRSRVLSEEGQRSEFLVWDLETPQEGKNLKHHEGDIWTVAFSPNGQLLASTASDGIVALWDLEKVDVSVTLTGHQGAVYGAAFSPVDHRVATAGHDQTVRIWDRWSGRLLHSVADHQRWVNTVAYSPDGSLLASASGDGTVKVRNGHSGEVLLEFTGHKKVRFPMAAQATTVIFSPDGREIASAGYDSRVRLWDPTSGQERLSLVHKGRVHCVAYRPDGQAIAACTAIGEVKLWNVTTGEEMQDFGVPLQKVDSVAFSPDGQRLATSGGKVRIFDIISGLEILSLPGGRGRNGVAFSPDGRHLAAGGPANTVWLWDGSPTPPDESFQP